ncbi:di-glucose binding protein with Kinesin motor domain-containing protein [Actinidia rufa]|uniref:Kinesin-like protein n=1 Tax=Actinidia rufa TaxID=165716 RepID=A0A7J0DWG7_9ERIC|nr:di-glucose binding protein with Kinesin motor domain-containing protein [Actinidia rufa]
MADTRLSASRFDSETPNSSSSTHILLDCANDLTRIDLQAQSGDSISVLRNKDCCYEDDAITDSVLCVSGSRLVRTGFKKINLSGNIVTFVNAGGGAIATTGDSSISIMPDTSFEGGDILRTEEGIIDDNDFAPLYQSARFGNFCYRFDNLLAGDYFVDLHFVEIINTNGPKGMRYSLNDMKIWYVVSDLDIYSIVGANKPLQLVDIRVTVGEDGVIVIRFNGVNGNPLVSGICIKRAPKILAYQVKQHGLVCNNCAAEIEVSSAQNRHIRMRSTVKYEKKIEELSTQCQLKTNECYEAWMSLTAANEELQKVRMELDHKSFENHCLDQAKATEAAKLKDLSSRCEHKRRFWAATIDELKRNIQTMKAEHSQLSREAHQCADSIPELDKMVKAVRGLGIVEAKVENIKEAWDVLQAGSNARAVGSNNVNEHSSRSHCLVNFFPSFLDSMLCIMVGAKNLINGECTKSKLWLVDLAGSERLAKTEAQGDMLKEAQNINRSLSALGDVISALASKSSHIPYRNSKLTHLLQDSLGGDSKTLMFVQISPSEQDLSETQSSLNFATRVRGVELGPAKRQIDVCELQKLKLHVNELQGKLRDSEHVGSKSLQHQIEELENKLEKKTQDFELQTVFLQENVMELEENKLKLQRSNTESESLHEKIKELEQKLRHQVKVSENIPPLFSSEKSKATPTERKPSSTTECTLERDYYSLSLKSSNRSMSHGSVLLKGTDSLRELRRKRDLQSGGIENSLLFSAPSIEKKLVLIESNKARQIDPSKAFARVTRTTKPFPSAQRFSSSKQVSGAKEKDANTRVWLR